MSENSRLNNISPGSGGTTALDFYAPDPVLTAMANRSGGGSVSVDTPDSAAGGRPSAEPSRDERPLRILHVAEAFGGGLLEICRMQAEGAAARGHTVAIAYGRRPETPQDVRSVVDDSVELFETPWVDRGMSSQIRAAHYTRALARRWNPDVIHLQSSFAGFMGVLALRNVAPLVYSPQGFAFSMRGMSRARGLVYSTLERIVSRRVTVIGASSAAERDQAVYRLGAPRTAVIENGIPELNRPIEGRSRDRRPLVIAVGRLRPQRQPERAAEILAGLRDVADVLWVGGGDEDGPEATTLRNYEIPYTGWVTREQVLNYLDEASVYLHWTAWDGLPLSILEALAHDVPVIAHDIPPNREVVGPEQVFSDEAAASEAIRNILTDPSTRARVLHSQRTRRQFYGSERMIDDWTRLYSQLAA